MVLLVFPKYFVSSFFFSIYYKNIFIFVCTCHFPAVSGSWVLKNLANPYPYPSNLGRFMWEGAWAPRAQINSLGVLERSDPQHALVILFGKERPPFRQSINCIRHLLHQKRHIHPKEGTHVELGVNLRRATFYLGTLACTIFLEDYQQVYQW